MLLIADLAPPMGENLLTVQRNEDCGMTDLGCWDTGQVTRVEKPVHPDDIAHLQMRLDLVSQSAGVLVSVLHDENGIPINRYAGYAGDFEVDGGRLELHGLLVDSETPFFAAQPGIHARRLSGHLFTVDSGLYRHYGRRTYTTGGELLDHTDRLSNMTPDGKIGRISLAAFAEIDHAVDRGMRVATNLGNEFGVVTPVYEAHMRGEVTVTA